MIGTLVNTVAVLGGGIIGLLLKKRMPERVTSIYFQAIGLFTLVIGITMAIKMGGNILIVVSSLAVGSLLGEWWDIEKGAERMSDNLKNHFHVGSEKFSEGLVTAFLLFCVGGSMTILGTIQEGTGGSPDLLYTKSLMDFFSLPSCFPLHLEWELFSPHSPCLFFRRPLPCSPDTPGASSPMRSFSGSPAWEGYYS